MAGSERRRPSWRWRDWPLRWKGLAVVSLPVAALVALSILGLLAQGTHDRLDKAEDDASSLRAVASQTLVAVLDLENAARGYLLSGDPDDLAAFEHVASRDRLSLLLARLGRLLMRDPDRLHGVTTIKTLVAELKANATFAVRSGPDDVTRGILIHGRVLMDELHSEIDGIIREEEAELVEARQELADQERVLAAIQFAGLGLGLLGGLAGVVLFTTGVARRVRRLEANAGRLADGEPLAALPPGRDEVAGLGRAMEAAATRLGKAQNLLRGVIDGTSDVVFVKDLEGRYLLMNEAGCSYLGRPLGEIIGRTDEELYEAGLAASIRDADRVILRTGETTVHETVDTVRGMPRTYLTTKGPFRDGSGDVAGIFGISREITDRVLAEQERDRFFTLSQDLFAIADLEGRFVRLNPAWEQVLGYSVEELTGRAFVDFVHPEDRERTEAEAASLAEGGNESVAFENRYRNRDGSYRWFMWKSRTDVQTGRIFAAARDITERKLAEAQMEEVNAALSESEERFRHLFANSPDAVIMVDPHDPNGSWPIVDCNEAACRMNGYTREELRGEPVDILNVQRATPEERAEFLERLRREGLVSVETLHRHKDGHTFPVEISTSVISLNGRELVMGIDRDITVRRQLEKEAADRAEDLVRSNEELEQFAYVASHDLQEPLRIVAGYAQLLSKRYRGTLGEDADEFIEYMVDGVRRMQELIDALLQYSRVGRKGREMAPVDLDVAFDDAMANLQAAIEESRARVTRDDLPDVVADRLQLAQLFQNLIGNALKFKGEEPPAVHVGAERHNGEWILEVRDNGIGIEPQYVDRIFDIFERLHSRERYDGTGIGLSICKKIVERHGGRIWVESDAGRGSAFRFTIPATQGQ